MANLETIRQSTTVIGKEMKVKYVCLMCCCGDRRYFSQRKIQPHIQDRLEEIKRQNDEYKKENHGSAKNQVRVNLYDTHIRR